MKDVLMTPTAVSRELGKSEQTVRVYALTGKLPCIRTTTGRRLFLKSDVDAFVRKQRDKEPPAA
jgi:predicted site-specific integrase-resolvase